MGNTRVDTAAMRAAAHRFGAAAEILDGALLMRGLRFDGSTAGRAHTARGDGLRAALDRLTGEIANWSRAAEEIAAAVLAGADRYADAEVRAAAGVQ